MLVIFYSILNVILIFITSNYSLLIVIFAVSLINVIYFKIQIKKILLKIAAVSPMYFSILVLSVLFHRSGKYFFIFNNIKIYSEGLKIGLDIFIRSILSSMFIFSLDITTRKDNRQ